MRIAFYAPHFAEYALRLGIARAEFGPVLLAVNEKNLSQECDGALIEKAEGSLTLMRFNAQGRWQKLAALLKLLVRIILFRPDLVHVQEQTDQLSYWVVRLLSWFYPIMLTVHDPKPHVGSDADWARRMTPYREGIRRLARSFHVHGEHCRAALASTFSVQKPIISTQHGVILTPTPEQERAPERRRMLMFGRMEAYKGLGALVEAAEILHRDGVIFELVLAGRGPELDRLADKIAENSSIQVLRKFLSVEEAVAEFQKAAFVVLPYVEATQSGVVAAAFGNHRPVLATCVGGLADSITDGVNGILIAPHNVPLLADDMKLLLEDDAAWQKLMAGAQSAISAFDWREICLALNPAYEEAIGHGRN